MINFRPHPRPAIVAAQPVVPAHNQQEENDQELDEEVRDMNMEDVPVFDEHIEGHIEEYAEEEESDEEDYDYVWASESSDSDEEFYEQFGIGK